MTTPSRSDVERALQTLRIISPDHDSFDGPLETLRVFLDTLQEADQQASAPAEETPYELSQRIEANLKRMKGDGTLDRHHAEFKALLAELAPAQASEGKSDRELLAEEYLNFPFDGPRANQKILDPGEGGDPSWVRIALSAMSRARATHTVADEVVKALRDAEPLIRETLNWRRNSVGKRNAIRDLLARINALSQSRASGRQVDEEVLREFLRQQARLIARDALADIPARIADDLASLDLRVAMQVKP